MKKNLVMGSGSGFDWNIFEPFVTSFVKYAKNTELVLFVKDLSDFTTDRIKRSGGQVLNLSLSSTRIISGLSVLKISRDILTSTATNTSKFS